MKKFLFIALISAQCFTAEEEKPALAPKEWSIEDKSPSDAPDLLATADKTIGLASKALNAIDTTALLANIAVTAEQIVEKTITEGIALPGGWRTTGNFFNPFSDICWPCFLPLHIGGVNILSAEEEFIKNKIDASCHCNDSLLPGIPLSFWETSALVEVTQIPYKFCSLNRDLSNQKDRKFYGGTNLTDAGSNSFYHFHYIPIPIFRILGLVPGFQGMTKTEEMSLIPWFSELDVSWRHQELAKLFSPGKGKELKSKANVESMKNCEKDCEASNKREPVLENNDYWWCAGCLGPLYPLTGHVGNHIGGIQSSSLIMHRALAKIHFLRTFFEWPTGYDPNEYCHQRVFNYLPKTFYKTQLVYPTPDKKTTKIGNYKKGYCHPFGQSVQGWATAKKKSEAQQRPDGGEDFTYLVWTKVQCCITPTFGIDILQSINEQIENGINHFMNALPDTLQNLYQDRDKIANGVKSISGLEEKAANVLNRVKELPTAMNKNYSNLRDLELQKLQNQLNEPNEVSNNKIKHFGGQK